MYLYYNYYGRNKKQTNNDNKTETTITMSNFRLTFQVLEVALRIPKVANMMMFWKMQFFERI